MSPFDFDPFKLTVGINRKMNNNADNESAVLEMPLTHIGIDRECVVSSFVCGLGRAYVVLFVKGSHGPTHTVIPPCV